MDILKLKNIAVTGAAGFIGSQMTRLLNHYGHTVIAVDHPHYFQERNELKDIPFQHILSRSQFLNTLSAPQQSSLPPIHAIIHLGACSNTTEKDEAYLKETNIDYTKKIWNACVHSQIPLIYASSAATYGAGENGYSDDESILHSLKPLNLYGHSKKTVDDWVLGEESHNRTPPQWSGFKFFNVYGFGEAHKKKMASVVFKGYQQIKKQKKTYSF